MRSPIKPISDKQRIENQKKRGVKYVLHRKQEGYCARCGRWLHWNQCELSHKKHIGMGGCKDNSVNTEEDCEVTCRWFISGCHPNEEHHQRNKYNEQPIWSKEG